MPLQNINNLSGSTARDRLRSRAAALPEIKPQQLRKMQNGQQQNPMLSLLDAAREVERMQGQQETSARDRLRARAAKMEEVPVLRRTETVPESPVSQEEPQEKLNFWQRIGQTLKGAGLQYGAGLTNAAGVASDAVGGTAMSGVYRDQVAMLDRQIEALNRIVNDSGSTAQDRMEAQEALKTAYEQRKIYNKAVRGNREAAKRTYDLADEMAKSGTAHTERAKSGLGTMGKIGIDLISQGAQMAGDIALGAATGGGSLAAMGARTFGSGAQEARQEGASLQKAALYGAGSAAVEVLTEKMFDGLAGIYGKGGADEIVGKAINKLTKNETARRALNVAASAAGESIEELVSGLANPALKTIYNGKSLGKNYSEMEAGEILYSMLVGGLMGGLGGTVDLAKDGVNSAAQRVNLERTYQETGAAIKQQGMLNDLVQMGLGMDAETQKSAQAIQEKLANGGTVSDREAGMLLRQVTNEAKRVQAEDAQKNNAAPEGTTVNNQNGGIDNESERTGEAARGDTGTVLRRGEERNDSVRAGGEAGDMERGTEQGRNVSRAEQVQKANSRRDAGKDLPKVSLREHGFQTVTEERATTVLPETHWDDELRTIRQEAAAEGLDVTFVLGRPSVKAGNGVCHVRGIFSDGKVAIQVDNNGLSARQIWEHERFHNAVRNDPELMNRTRERIVQQYGEEELTRAYEKYLEAMDGVLDLPEDATQEQIDAAINRALEEVFADANAGINFFDAQADRFHEPVHETVQESRNTVKPKQDTAERYSLDSEELERRYLDYRDKRAQDVAIRDAMIRQKQSGKTVTISPETIRRYKSIVSWDDIGAARRCVKDAVKQVMGNSVFFEMNGGRLEAYVTATGKNHYAYYPTPEKAAAMDVFRNIVQNATYAFSAEHDIHSEEGKLVQANVWDYFVAPVDYGNGVDSFLFCVRSIDRDSRAQIYSMITQKNEAATSHEDGLTEKPQGRRSDYEGFTASEEAATSRDSGLTENPQGRHSSYGGFTASDETISDAERDVKSRSERKKGKTELYSMDEEQEEQKAKETEKKKEKPKKPPVESKPTIAKANFKRDMLSLFSIPEGRRKAMGEIIDQFADKRLKDGKLSQADYDAFFRTLYAEGVMTVPADEATREVREMFKGGRIYVNDDIRGDFGDDWNDFRARAFAAGLYLTNNTADRGPDLWNEELGKSLPGVFKADEYDGRTVLENIVQMAEEGKDQKLNLDEYIAMLSGEEHTPKRELLDNMERQVDWALRTFAEKANLEVYLRDRTGVKLAQQKAKWREARETESRRRELKDLEQRTLKQLQWLNKNRDRVPRDLKSKQAYQEVWNAVLGDIDIYAAGAANEMRFSKKHGATWRDLAEMYKEAQKSDPNFMPSKELEQIVARLENKKIEDMEPLALSDLYKAAVGLREEYYNRKRMLGDQLNAMIADVYAEAKQEIESAPKGYTGKKLNRFLNMEQLTPMNFLDRMAGWNTNGVLHSMAQQLEQGEREMRDYRVKAERELEGFLKEHKDWVKKADGQGKDAIWYELEVPELLERRMGDKPIFGDTIKVYMTPAQKVHMYLESKNYDNLRHMEGGRTFVNRDLYSKGKRQEAFAQGTTVRLAPETVQRLVSDLTPEEMALAETLEKYYNEFSTKRINEKSNILYGYDKAMGKNYAPIYTNHNYVQSEIGVFDTTAEGVGNLKTRIKGANPSYNIGAFDAFERHVDQTARFVGMAIPARNWQTLLNWQEKNNSMGDVITHKWGEEAKSYITDLLTTLQGGNRGGKKTLEGLSDKALSNYITAVFGANPGIVFKQAASFPQFAAALGWKNAPSPVQMIKVDTNLINTYTSELAYRTLGYATPETAQLKNNPNFLDSNKATQFLFRGGAITAMDAGTVKRAWPWAENKVRKENPDLKPGTKEQIESGEDPFYRKVAEEFEYAVSLTQPMYDVMHRPDIMKNGSGVQRAFTMFKTVPLQQYNTLRRSFGELQYAKQQAKENPKSERAKENHEAASGKAAAAVTATVASVLMLEAVELLNQMVKNRGKKYRDDDDELTIASVGWKLARDATGDLMGMVIGGSELSDLLENWFMGEKWYGIEIPGGEQLNDIIDSMNGAAGTIQKIINDGTDIVKNGGDLHAYLRRHAREYAGAAKDIAEKTSMYLGGLPVQNLEKYIMGITQHISPELYTAMQDVFQTPTKEKLKGLNANAGAVRLCSIMKMRGAEIKRTTSNELIALYQSGYTDAVPPDTPNSITVDSEKIVLSAHESQIYERTWSKALSRRVDELAGAPEFQNADEETREKMLKGLYAYASDLAKDAVVSCGVKKSTENVNVLFESGLSTGKACKIAFGLKSLDGTSEQLNEIAGMKLTKQQTKAAAGCVMDTKMETDSGNPTQYAKLVRAIDAGMEPAEALRLRADGMDLGKVTELKDAGLDIKTAASVATAIAQLTPEDGKSDVSDVQKWRATLNTVSGAEKQMQALKAVMPEDQYRKVEIAHSFGVQPDSFVKLREILPQYDANHNGSYSQDEVKAAIDAMGGAVRGLSLPTLGGSEGLPSNHSAVLWQLVTGSTSAKNNPYSRSIGQQVLDAKERGKASGGGLSLPKLGG